MGFFKTLFCIYRKDSLSEWRNPVSFLTSLLFAMILASVYSYAIHPDVFLYRRNFEGILLATLFFSSTLYSSQSLRSELEAGALRIMNMSLLDPSGVYFAKVIVRWQNQVLFLFFCLPVYFLFLQGGREITMGEPHSNFQERWLLLLTCLSICAFSLSALGTLFAYISVDSNIRSILLPILLLPVSMPIFIFAIEFLEDNQNFTSLFQIPFKSYLTLIAPAGLYGGIGSLFYFRLVSDTPH